jgi:hypothetical protein
LPLRLANSLGDEIGSVEIDLAFQQLAKQRLQPLLRHFGHDQLWLTVASEQMTRSEFQILKEEFGTADSNEFPDFRIPIPGIPSTSSLRTADTIVTRGKLVISR